MRTLNKMKGFQWATKPRLNTGYAKVCIDGEVFWVKQCEPYGEGAFRGVVDNDLNEVRGLHLGDTVVFASTELS